MGGKEKHLKFKLLSSGFFIVKQLGREAQVFSQHWEFQHVLFSALVITVVGGWDFALQVLHSNLRDKANKSSKQHDLEFVIVTICK